VRNLPLDHFERAALQRIPSGIVERSGRCGLGERQDFTRDGADRFMLLDEQRRHVAVACFAHPREQFALLEVEVAADVLLDLPAQQVDELDDLLTGGARTRRTRQRLLDAAEQFEIDAMLVVERSAHLSFIAHGIRAARLTRRRLDR
jgi:hypothetical protein